MTVSEELTLLIALLGALGASGIIVQIVKNAQKLNMAHREIIAEASKSVLRRVEMYYRIRRRTTSDEDVINIRNLFHSVQEENEYFKALLVSRSKWHGQRYVMFIEAIQKLTREHTRDAWKQRPFGPDAEIKAADRPNHKRINELSIQFANDSRKLMNPFTNAWMSLRDSKFVQNFAKVNRYDV